MMQLKFYRCLLAVGQGCPKPSLYWETGGYLMRNRILKSKLLLLHHVSTLGKDTLAREVIDIQMELNLPGLYKECKEFLVKVGVTDLTKFTSLQWKKLVKTEVYKLNRNDVLNQMRKPYNKIKYEEHINSEMELQPYLKTMNISEARMKFRLKTKMTPTIRMNFASDPEYTSKLWSCQGCTEDKAAYDKVEGQRDTQAHVMVCPGYADLREDKDLHNDKDLVKYFQLVIKQRTDSEDEV